MGSELLTYTTQLFGWNVEADVNALLSNFKAQELE
jgi:hypothetical protein